MKCCYCSAESEALAICPACIHGLDTYYARMHEHPDRTQRHDLSAILSPVLAACATVGYVKADDIVGQCRSVQFAAPRQAAIWLLWRHSTATTTEIATAIGNRDHSTIVHARNVVNKQRSADAGRAWAIAKRADEMLGLAL